MTASTPITRGEARARIERMFLILVRKAVFEREAEFESRADIAARIGMSSCQLTRILNGGRRLTLRMVSDILFATGFCIDSVTAKPIDRAGE